MRYALLFMRPRAREDDYSRSHLTKGDDYHSRFVTLPGRALMWELERALLRTVLRQGKGVCRYLDFACGTGRVTTDVVRLLAPREAVGLDVAPSMLERARQEAPGVSFFCVDFREQDWSSFGFFDVITAFRFFPNAQPELREVAMRFLSSVLGEGAVLILNNHRNFWSLPFLGYRLAGAYQGTYGMTHSQIQGLAERNELEIVGTFSYGIVPQTEAKSVLPWTITRWIERLNSRVAARFHRLGYNVVYVLRRGSS